MQNLFAEDSMRKRGLIGVIVAAVAAMLAMLLMPMNQANAAPGDPMTVNGCTVDLPFGNQYQADGNPIDAGTQYLAYFYSNVTIDQLEGPPGDQQVVDTLDIEVPVECVVEVTATCDAVTFHTTLDWGTLRIEYGTPEEQKGEIELTGDTVSIPLDYNPFTYVVVETEMDRQFGGTAAPDCDGPAIPTVAPASGM